MQQKTGAILYLKRSSVLSLAQAHYRRFAFQEAIIFRDRAT